MFVFLCIRQTLFWLLVLEHFTFFLISSIHICFCFFSINMTGREHADWSALLLKKKKSTIFHVLAFMSCWPQVNESQRKNKVKCLIIHCLSHHEEGQYIVCSQLVSWTHISCYFYLSCYLYYYPNNSNVCIPLLICFH